MKSIKVRGAITTDKRVVPLQDNIALEMLNEEKQTSSGIIIPAFTDIKSTDPTQNKPLYGRVIAVGPGKYNKIGKRVRPDVNIGEIVFINKWGGTKLMLDNKEITIIRENEAIFIADKQY